jgi:hypothetical protein
VWVEERIFNWTQIASKLHKDEDFFKLRSPWLFDECLPLSSWYDFCAIHQHIFSRVEFSFRTGKVL